ncbi:MAG: hypothetical protein U0350_51470 [Caldilineaceae bacterium]
MRISTVFHNIRTPNTLLTAFSKAMAGGVVTTARQLTWCRCMCGPSRESDLSRERAARFPQMKIYPTVADALTLGTDTLAVDGVLLIGEHGTYGNERKRATALPALMNFFRQIPWLSTGQPHRSPFLNDKHLSWR